MRSVKLQYLQQTRIFNMDFDDQDDHQGVTKAKSAYTYFMTLNGGSIKDSEKEGSVLGALAAKVFLVSFSL